MTGAAWLDLTLLAVLLVSALVGLWRGMVFELLSLMAWGAALLLAWTQAAPLAQAVGRVSAWPEWQPEAAWARAVCGAAIFIGMLLLASLLAHAVRRLVRATPLTLLDRAGGLGFGLLRGALGLALLVGLGGAVAAVRESSAWRSSQVVRAVEPWVGSAGELASQTAQAGWAAGRRALEQP